MPRRDLSEGVQSKIDNPELVEDRRNRIAESAIKLFAKQGFYKTTIEQIAKEAGFSHGFIYQYFRSKEELLLYSLRDVLNSYETEIPPKLEGVRHPIDRLCTAITAYCRVVDAHTAPTILAYRSTKSLKPEMQRFLKADEIRTNRFIRDAVKMCINDGYMTPVDLNIAVYQYVMFCHSWALKSWVFKNDYTLDQYISEGLKILVRPLLTQKGEEYWNKYWHDNSALAGA